MVSYSLNTHPAREHKPTARCGRVVSQQLGDRFVAVISILPLSKYTPARVKLWRRSVLDMILVFFLASSVCAAIPAQAQKLKTLVKPRGVVLPQERNQSGFSVQIVPNAESTTMRVLSPERGILELGAVSATGGNSTSIVRKTARSMIVSSEFSLRVTGDSATRNQVVTINGFLTHAGAMQWFRLDGQALSATPVPITRKVAVGTVTRHRLEIEIPFSATEAGANVNVSLGFTVSTN